jgi:hypothetical protein
MNTVEEALAAVESLRKQKSVTAREILPVLTTLAEEVMRLQVRVEKETLPRD